MSNETVSPLWYCINQMYDAIINSDTFSLKQIDNTINDYMSNNPQNCEELIEILETISQIHDKKKSIFCFTAILKYAKEYIILSRKDLWLKLLISVFKTARSENSKGIRNQIKNIVDEMYEIYG